MRNLQIIKRFYSTPIGIYNFKPINRTNYTKKLTKPLPLRNSSYMNMYSALKSKIKQPVRRKKHQNINS